MRRVEYLEVQCKTALNRVKGMPFKWSLNPYRGCAHGCHYCYARASHTYFDLNGGDDFETKILVKMNFPDVLRRELGRPSWKAEQVALGTVTDCYQPAEGRYRLTRTVLEALRDAATPVGMVTKSPMVLRDLDVLGDLSRSAPVRVFFTITTVDLGLWRTLEPGTANPFKRLHVMRLLNEAGVRSGVLLAPILPGITDSRESIEAVAAAAADHGAAFFGATALRLAPIVKEHYLGFVGSAFPALLPRYERAYPGAYAPGAYAPGAYIKALDERVGRVRLRHGFDEDSMRARRIIPDDRAQDPSIPCRRGPQLGLPM